MGQTNSNPVRLYTPFILLIKRIHYFGYFLVVLLGFLMFGFAGGMFQQSPLAVVALLFLLLQLSIGCGMIYVVTQALIAIVDLLSRIEQNTRP